MTHRFFRSPIAHSAPMSASPRMIEDRESIAFGQMVRAADSSFLRSDSLMRIVAETVRLDTTRIVTFITLDGNSYKAPFGPIAGIGTDRRVTSDARLSEMVLLPPLSGAKALSENCCNVAINSLPTGRYSGLLAGYRGNPHATLVCMRTNSEGVSLPCGNSPQRFDHGTHRNHFRFGDCSALRRGTGRNTSSASRRSDSAVPATSSELLGKLTLRATSLSGGSL